MVNRCVVGGMAGVPASSSRGDEIAAAFQDMKKMVKRKQDKGELDGLDICFRINILAPRPRSWLIDLGGRGGGRGGPTVEEVGALEQQGGGSSSNDSTTTPNLTMTYESVEVFLALKNKTLNARTAVTSGKLRLTGDLSKLGRLHAVFEAWGEDAEEEEGAGGTGAVVVMKPVARSEWDPDGPSCRLCQAQFTVTLRRHHCRFCGALTCKDCSKFSLGGRRACAICFLKQQRASWDGRLGVQHQHHYHQGGSEGAGGEEEQVRERLVSLEAKLKGFERARHERKGRALLRFADLLIASIHASYLIAGVIASHHVSTLLCIRLDLPTYLYEHYLSSSPSAAWVEEAAAVMSSYLPPPLLHHLHLQPYTVMMIACLLLLFRVMRGRRHCRSVQAFSIATVLVITLKLAKLKAGRALAGASESVWHHTHSYCAAYLRLAFFRLGGMYLKMGQWISSRSDAVPEPYTEELAALQDAVPPSPLSLITPMIERQLGGRLRDMFGSFGEEALASASIAQVHRATIKGPRADDQVVVKVQHPGIAELLSIDLSNIISIFRTVAWLEPAYDFTMVVEEWTSEVYKELDFRTEGENISRAYEGFRKSGLDVEVPQLILATPAVLVMTYCEGVKVTDPRAFPQGAEDRAEYMRAVCEAFAHGMYMQGFFNGDPHPGNLLVQRIVEDNHTAAGALQPPPTTTSSSSSNGTITTTTPSRHQQEGSRRGVRPVLLDWGLAKALPEHVRVGNAKIVYHAWMMDIAGMLNGMHECGMDVSKVDILQDIKNIRFLMRNTSPGVESREQSKRFVEDFMDTQNAKPKNERNPLRAAVPDLLFLARVTELLQGLGAKLGTRVEYMEIMARFSRQAILEDVMKRESGGAKAGRRRHQYDSPFTTPVGGRRKLPPPLPSSPLLRAQGAFAPLPRAPPPGASSPSSLSFLDRKVHALLQRLIGEGCCLGSQVVMIKHGRVLVNTAVGSLGPVDPRPVGTSTLFHGLSLCKLTLAVLTHSLVEEGVLTYDTPLSRYWPAMASSPALASITIRHVLTHTSGLQYIFPPSPTPQSLCHPDAGQRAVFGATQPATPPGTHTSFHYYSYGWLLVPVLEAASKRTIAQLVRDKISRPLGIEEEFIVGPLPPPPPTTTTTTTPRLTSVDYDLRSTVSLTDMNAMSADDSPLVKFMEMLPPSGEERDDAALRDLLQTKLAGREFLFDPRLVNYHGLASEHGLPGLNGRFSARAMAEFLEALCRTERKGGQAAAPSPSSASSSSSTTTTPVSSSAAAFFGAATPVSSSNGTTTAAAAAATRSSRAAMMRRTVGAGGIVAPSPGNSSGSFVLSSPSPVVMEAATSVGPVILPASRLREMRSSARRGDGGGGGKDEEPRFTRLLGRESPIRLGMGAQVFGFRHHHQQQGEGAGGRGTPGSGSRRGGGSTTTVRYGAYGHASGCGQLAMCDPSTGLVLVVMSNRAPTPGQKSVGMEVLRLIAEELGMGEPLPIW